MPASQQFWNLEWLSSNAQRSYPLAEHATKRDVTDSIAVPDSFLVELYLPIGVAAAVQSDKFFLKTLTIAGGGYIIEIGYDNGDEDPPVVATAAVSQSGFVQNKRFNLIGVGDFDDALGGVTIGRLDDIQSLPAGVYNFTHAAGVLDPDCIRPMIRTVNSISIEQNGVRSAKFTGPIVISAGPGMRISPSSGDGVTTIRFDAIPGEGFNAQCACQETLPDPIRTINGVSGDANYNLTVLVDDCLRLSALTNGLLLENICSQPCCTDEELAEIRRVIAGLRDNIHTLENFATGLNSSLQASLLNMMSNRLSDRPCGS